MNYSEFKKGIHGLIMPYEDEYDGDEVKSMDLQIKLFTNLAIDAMQRETYPLEKSTVLTGAECVLPEDMIDFLGVEPNEPFELEFDENGKRYIRFKKAGDHKIWYTYNSGPVSDDKYEFDFPLEVVSAMMYFVAYHMLAGENDTRQYAAYYNLYNQACANIITSRQKRCKFVGGVAGV